MGKKSKLPFLFMNKQSSIPHPLRRYWLSCKHPSTLSFRASKDDDEVYKTVNSIFLDDPDIEIQQKPEDISFANSESAASFSREVEENDDVELLIHKALQSSSERLIFEPHLNTNSIMEDQQQKISLESSKGSGGLGRLIMMKESLVLAMESDDPYLDFKRSMEEMVESHSLKEDWECLEELLGWYLKMNWKKNHGFIIEAFVDLLVGLASSSSSSSSSTTSNWSHNGGGAHLSSSTSFFSAPSFLSSAPTFSPVSDHKEIDEEKNRLSVS